MQKTCNRLGCILMCILYLSWNMSSFSVAEEVSLNVSVTSSVHWSFGKIHEVFSLHFCILHTVKSYFNHILVTSSCIPFVFMTRKVQGMLTIFEQWNFSISFRKVYKSAFVVSLILHICLWRIPWLHACGRNARNVAK